MPRRNRNRHPKRIPTFENIEQEAGFWDTHNPEDYGSRKGLTQPLNFVLVHEMKLYIEHQDFEQLRAEALARNMKTSTLAEQIIEAHLHNYGSECEG